MACLGSVTAVVAVIEAGAVAAGTRSCIKKCSIRVSVRRFVRKSEGSRGGVEVTSSKRKMMHLRDIARGGGGGGGRKLSHGKIQSVVLPIVRRDSPSTFPSSPLYQLESGQGSPQIVYYT